MGSMFQSFARFCGVLAAKIVFWPFNFKRVSHAKFSPPMMGLGHMFGVIFFVVFPTLIITIPLAALPCLIWLLWGRPEIDPFPFTEADSSEERAPWGPT